MYKVKKRNKYFPFEIFFDGKFVKIFAFGELAHEGFCLKILEEHVTINNSVYCYCDIINEFIRYASFCLRKPGCWSSTVQCLRMGRTGKNSSLRKIIDFELTPKFYGLHSNRNCSEYPQASRRKCCPRNRAEYLCKNIF